MSRLFVTRKITFNNPYCPLSLPCSLTPLSPVCPVTFSTSFGGGEVSYTSPMVVEWRFSPPTQVNQGAVLNEAPNRKRPNFDRPPVPNSSPGLPLTRETKHTLSQRLRRRLEKFRGKKEWKIGGAWREIRRGILGRHQPGTSDRMNGRGVSYVVVLLPVGPGRTKVFARWVGALYILSVLVLELSFVYLLKAWLLSGFFRRGHFGLRAKGDICRALSLGI